eukprot:TRINITY_DN29313_c0_g1_i1.p1 TRINITY_DN29313_c0_g1~~TRINITY_DN29313_c0_g1_i1.p1  ORF type:complete len:538 (+),score=78.83 TRINITY_DN29313_c0_g1_i1:44-1615(+)
MEAQVVRLRNIPRSLSKEEFARLCESCGEVKDFQYTNYTNTQAQITFKTSHGAHKGVAFLNGKEVGGQILSAALIFLTESDCSAQQQPHPQPQPQGPPPPYRPSDYTPTPPVGDCSSTAPSLALPTLTSFQAEITGFKETSEDEQHGLLLKHHEAHLNELVGLFERMCPFSLILSLLPFEAQCEALADQVVRIVKPLLRHLCGTVAVRQDACTIDKEAVPHWTGPPTVPVRTLYDVATSSIYAMVYVMAPTLSPLSQEGAIKFRSAAILLGTSTKSPEIVRTLIRDNFESQLGWKLGGSPTTLFDIHTRLRVPCASVAEKDLHNAVEVVKFVLQRLAGRPGTFIMVQQVLRLLRLTDNYNWPLPLTTSTDFLRELVAESKLLVLDDDRLRVGPMFKDKETAEEALDCAARSIKAKRIPPPAYQAAETYQPEYLVVHQVIPLELPTRATPNRPPPPYRKDAEERHIQQHVQGPDVARRAIISQLRDVQRAKRARPAVQRGGPRRRSPERRPEHCQARKRARWEN